MDLIEKFRVWLPSLGKRQTWIAVGVGIAIGISMSLWMNWPTPPWLEFSEVRATYETGGECIAGRECVKVTGIYTARKACSREEENTPEDAPDPLEWEQRVRGTGDQIVWYAARPAPPKIEIGTHRFHQEIPLTEGILPDGWSVSVTVSCGREPIAIRSRAAVVQYVVPDGT